VTGAAPNVLEDIEALKALGLPECDWMAIGLDAVDKYAWPIRFMATYHPEDLARARERRAGAKGNTDYIELAYNRKAQVTEAVVDGVKCSLKHEGKTGSSALMGTLLGLKIGYGKIVLCGCPLSGKYERYRAGWREKEALLTGKVKSMSGWTMEFLGRPTPEWIGGN